MVIYHELKCWVEYFEQLYQKPFEVRNNDRGFKKGDVLLLREWDPKSCEYTGRQCLREITYILSEHEGLTPGYVCLGLGSWQSTTFIQHENPATSG